MTPLYLMGIDNGGSSVKCAVYDQFGHMLACASEHPPMQRGPAGETERRAEDIWQANCRVIRKALIRSGLRGSDISCIGLCGYGGGLGMLDSDQKPTAPFIVSTDSRAEPLLQELLKDGTEARVYARTLQRLWAGQQAVLLPWYKRERLEIYEKCAHVVTIKDFIRFRLVGRLATEATDASNTNLFSIFSGNFDRDLFDILNISESFERFPKHILRPFDVAGYVTKQAAAESGLFENTPVVTGLYDVAACCLGSGILDEQKICLVVGTWSICGRLTRSLEDCKGESNALCAFADKTFFLEESSPTSVSNLDWFIEQFFSKMLLADERPTYKQCDDLVANLNPADCDLIFLPYLYGSNTILGARACFFNLESHHTSGHMLLAVYEGILFSLLHHIQNLTGNQPLESVRLSGGVSRSPLWCQMLCNILGVPLEVMENGELGALGSAICAAVAAGVYPDFAAASSAMCRIGSTYFPDFVRTALYQKKYQCYCKAVKSLKLFYCD